MGTENFTEIKFNYLTTRNSITNTFGTIYKKYYVFFM